MKVGDRVKTLTDGGYIPEELRAGQCGEIVEIDKGFIKVRMDNGYLGELWTYYPEELEVIQ